ncbi:MAG: DNRLRE domain-containing protein [Nitrospirae bacterium]|nr:DNRLRE domain-containing protein [Nitrospirota bacterium]
MVVRNNGAQDRYLHLNTHRGELDIATNGQTLGHAAAAEAFGVAAVNVATAGGGDFIGGASNPVETFSSDGPRRIFYHADGSEVTPGNLSASGGLVRQKPDIAAADGVSTSTPGFNPFFGTSAAAPHAAAIAALVKSANLSLSNAQIRTALESTALDIEAPGVDQDSGHGLLDAFAAVQSVNPTVQRELTVTFGGNGTGSVVSNVGSINCPVVCSHSYDLNTVVTLSASADSGYEFTGWNGAGCSGIGTCVVTMNQLQTVTATFQGSQALSVIFGGTGTGSVTDNDSVTCVANCLAFFDYNISVTLQASADTGSVFTGWSGAGCSGSGDCVLAMDQARTVTATFGPEGGSGPLAITNLTTGSGRTYQVIPDGLQIGATVYIDRSFTYSTIPGSLQGATYIQTANADKSSQGPSFFSFDVNQPVTVYVGHDQRITDTPVWVSAFVLSGETWVSSDTTFTVYTQTFPVGPVVLGGNHETATGKSMYTIAVVSNGPPPPPPSYSLTVTMAGSGSGLGQVTSDVGTIDCPASNCGDTYPDQTVVTLDAGAPAGTIFTGWSGAGCSGLLSCVVMMNQAHLVTATFELEHILTVQLAGPGNGTVTSDLGSIHCPTTCQDSYGQGTTVMLTAVPNPTIEFTGWTGAGCSGTGPCLVTLLQAETVTATFATDTTGPTVTINQAAGQADPTNTSSINLTVVFSEIVTDFATGDVTLGGAAGATTATVTGSGLTYNVAVSGMATDGTVTASLAAGVATDSVGNANSASTSTDNTVTFTTEVPPPPPSTGTVTFREGENGYTGTQDAFIRGSAPDASQGDVSFLTWTSSGEKSVLIRFDNVFGGGADQVPIGATITSATLTLEVYDDGLAAEIYEAAVDWTEAETFNSLGSQPGVQAEDLGPLLSAVGGTVPVGPLLVDVRSSLSAWTNNPTANRGWIFRPTGSSPVLVRSSEANKLAQRPQLSVTYQMVPGDPALTVTVVGSGSGTVTDNGPLSCSTSCSATYPLNSSVTLHATADPGLVFTGWSGAGCSGTGDCLVTMDQAQNVTATFEGVQTLTVTLAGTGSGTVTDGNLLTCTTDCIADYDYNTSVTLQASAEPGSVFTGWSGAGCSGAGGCVLTMNQARMVTATFGAEGGSGPLAITNVATGSGRTYQVFPDGLGVGPIVYIDRTYTYTAVPAGLVGATFIQTANADKNSQGNSFFSFEVNQPVTVSVAHDQRIITKPNWLTTWTPTGEVLSTTDSTFQMYQQVFSAGSVTLGGNKDSGSGFSMYSVIITPNN